jgi:invasion protein IalB
MRGETSAVHWVIPQAAHKSVAAIAACALFAVSSAASAQSGTPAGPETLQLLFSPWVKLCNKDVDPRAKRICVTFKEGKLANGQLAVSVALVEIDGEQRKLFRLSMPYAVALQHGTRLIVDQQQPATAPFLTCLPPGVPPGGCISDYEATPDLIGRMKKAQLLTVQAIHMNGAALSPQFELKDFAKAYDGPPTDPKVHAEQQKKQQDELNKRTKDDTLQPQLRPKN